MLQYIEARYETGATPGNQAGDSSSFAAKVLYIPVLSFDFDDNVGMLFRDDELRGQNEPIVFTPEAFAPAWSLETRMYPDVLAFLLKAHLGAPVTTAGDGVITDLNTIVIPAGCTRHRWTAPYATGTTPQTTEFRVADVDDAVYWKIVGATIESIELNTPDAGGCRIKVSGRANYIGRIADPALTVAYEALTIPPFQKSFASLASLASSGAPEAVSVKIEKNVEHIRTFGGASTSPNLVEFGEGPPIVSGQIDTRRITTADWDAMIAATRFTVLIGWVSTAIIASAYPYKVYVQGPTTSAAYTGGGPDSINNRRRIPASWPFKLTRSAATSSVIEVVNATASYA